MEFCFVNLVEPGDDVIIASTACLADGWWTWTQRCGANVTKVETAWGRTIEPQQVADALKQARRPKLGGKSCTRRHPPAALTPVEEISRLAHEAARCSCWTPSRHWPVARWTSTGGTWTPCTAARRNV